MWAPQALGDGRCFSRAKNRPMREKTGAGPRAPRVAALHTECQGLGGRKGRQLCHGMLKAFGIREVSRAHEPNPWCPCPSDATVHGVVHPTVRLRVDMRHQIGIRCQHLKGTVGGATVGDHDVQRGKKILRQRPQRIQGGLQFVCGVPGWNHQPKKRRVAHERGASNLESCSVPASQRHTRPGRRSMDAQSWVAMTKVRPCWGSSCMSSKISSVVSGSRLPVGSSASRRGGSFSSARAMDTRCCSPPLSSNGNCTPCWAVPPR